MSRIGLQLSERLKSTFKQYIRHAIEHALSERESENDILQVIVNLQASLELLSKLYVLQSEGWQGIVDTRLHDKSETEVLLAIEKGTLKTTPYWKNKEFISEEIFLNDDDKRLLDRFQNHRNQVMHLGVINPSRDILNEAIWFIVRIIHQLNWQDTLPMSQQYMSNSLESLLGNRLYKKLITSSCYVDEAVDRAYELYDDVKLCIQCGNDSWALNEKEYRICVVCGYRGNEDTFGFIDCPLCKTNGALVYDPQNIASNEYLYGRCCACKELIPVTQCPGCGIVYKYHGVCEFCEN
jgi:hypothetical protein